MRPTVRPTHPLGRALAGALALTLLAGCSGGQPGDEGDGPPARAGAGDAPGGDPTPDERPVPDAETRAGDRAFEDAASMSTPPLTFDETVALGGEAPRGGVCIDDGGTFAWFAGAVRTSADVASVESVSLSRAEGDVRVAGPDRTLSFVPRRSGDVVPTVGAARWPLGQDVLDQLARQVRTGSATTLAEDTLAAGDSRLLVFRVTATPPARFSGVKVAYRTADGAQETAVLFSNLRFSVRPCAD